MIRMPVLTHLKDNLGILHRANKDIHHLVNIRLRVNQGILPQDNQDILLQDSQDILLQDSKDMLLQDSQDILHPDRLDMPRKDNILRHLDNQATQTLQELLLPPSQVHTNNLLQWHNRRHPFNTKQ